jgi:hypothetical protein
LQLKLLLLRLNLYRFAQIAIIRSTSPNQLNDIIEG